MLDHDPVNKDALIQKLDPRVRVVGAIYASFVTAIISDFYALAAIFVFSLLLIIMSGVKAADIIKKIFMIQGFVLFLWFILPFTYNGQVLYSFGAFNIYRPGIIIAALITIKSNTILLIFIALIVSMPLPVLGATLSSLSLPDKLVHLLLLSYRYIHVLLEEYQKLSRAAQLRGFHPVTSFHTYNTYANIAGMLFVRAGERAQRVHHAMICRGFKGKFYSLESFSIKTSDYIWGSFFIFFPSLSLLYTFYHEEVNNFFGQIFSGLF